MTPTQRLFRFLAAGLLLCCGAPALAQAEQAGGPLPTTLKERQQLLRMITQQQQSVLQQRFNCINRAANLAELERCERGDPLQLPGWYRGAGIGGWRCPMW